MVDPAVVERIIMRLQVVKYWKAASMTILLFDYLITFEREVELIWRSTWGIGKVLFLLARYSALIDTPMALYLSLSPHISAERCARVYVPAIWVAVFGIASAEAILFLRTSAFYGNAKKMVIFLISVWGSILIIAIVICELYLRAVAFGESPLPVVGCFQTAGSRIIYGDYLVLLLQETIIVALTFYHGVRSGGRSNDRLVKTLYRDGLFYFVYLFFISLVNIIVLSVGPPELVELLTPFQRIMHSVLSTRVLLHARGAAHCKELVTFSDVRFATTIGGGGGGGNTMLSAAISNVEGLSELDEDTAAQSSVDK